MGFFVLLAPMLINYEKELETTRGNALSDGVELSLRKKNPGRVFHGPLYNHYKFTVTLYRI